ncbi:hypothetical protein A2V71_02180 [Candidatus Berkelbacteria bacterium RBG_13_40_8]|uniref:Glycosyltransferase RgtA/B/C/D-like domain-containing protein n=1 Tax=Candidatus Berkelbacteria bacterium RBG_13_40_8 TaxID=1797467 RepID=A0A1F5DQ76_9BACT|nr:MAG: hypothetical protein A2V71_02180 [Candidatus Berkelbacteria bacterium RBG_13_40_8]
MQKLLVWAILLLSFGIMIFVAKKDSLTVDETVHMTAGYLHTWKGDYTYNSEHPPLANDLSGFFIGLVRPNLPKETPGDIDQWQYGDKFFYQVGNNPDTLIFLGRLPIILLTLALFYLVFLWASEVWGVKAGVLSLLFAVTCPNLLAHGHLATTDLILAFSFVLDFYILRKFILKSSWKNAVWLGVVSGLVLLSKFSGIIILPLNLFMYVVILAIRKDKFVLENFLKMLVGFSIALGLTWLVYLFTMRHNWLVAFKTYGLGWFGGVGWLFGLIKWLALPLKKFYEGMDVVRGHNEFGHLSFLNGSYSLQGHWYYFPLAIWYKTPIPVMIAFVIAIIYSFRKRTGELWEKALIILPAIIFFLISLKSNLNIGLRHILPVYPLIYIFIGELANVKNILFKILVVALAVANLFSAVRTFPDYLSYFNINAGGRAKGYEHLGDSNFDWGQNVGRFADYLKKNNIQKVYFSCYDVSALKYYGIEVLPPPTQPIANGVIALCGQQYILQPVEKPEYQWFTKYPPDEVMANTIFVWRFPK